MDSKAKTSKHIKNIVTAGLCLALCMLLPFLTGQIPEIGSMLSPMHIPVLLCGFLCGWRYAVPVGAVAPLLRFLWLGMPPLMPTGFVMVFELAAYGLFTAIIYHKLAKKPLNIYISLIAAMFLGRVVWGIVSYLVFTFMIGAPFTFAMFLSGAFVLAVPGIICHILLIPPVVMALRRAGIAE